MTSKAPGNILIGGPASAITGSTAPMGTVGTSGINSSADTGGTYTILYPVNPNNQGGFLWIPIPEHKIIVPPSQVIVLYFLAAPGTTTGWTFSLWFDEVY